MAYMPTIAGRTVAISISESPDMSVLGLSDAHLRDAMDRLALHLLASGASLAYGGDLRANGFTDWLFELVSRYQRPASGVRIGVTNYLAWPIHISMDTDELEAISDSLVGTGELVCLTKEGSPFGPGGMEPTCAASADCRGMGCRVDHHAARHARGDASENRVRWSRCRLQRHHARHCGGRPVVTPKKSAAVPARRFWRLYAGYCGDPWAGGALGRLPPCLAGPPAIQGVLIRLE